MLNENQEIFIKSRLEEYRRELEDVLNGGDITEYNYCPSGEENDDMHFENRLRLSIAILYNSSDLDVETLSYTLLNEEAKLLGSETSYGGLTKTAVFLTEKLLEYGKSYKKLFKRIRRANFDCWFEYDIPYIKKRLNKYNWCDEDWDYIFDMLGDDESQKKFAELNGDD